MRAPAGEVDAAPRGGYVRKVLLVFHRGLLRELRARETVPSILSFSALVLVVFYFAFAGNPGAVRTPGLSSGILWVTLAFAGVLGFQASWNPEREGEALKGLLLCPVDRSAIYLGKVLENLVFLLAVEIVTLLLFTVFYGTGGLSWLLRAAPVFALATLGFSAVGTMVASLSLNARLRELLLPLLFLPLSVPVLIAGSDSTARILSGEPLSAAGGWVRLLAVYDLVFVSLAFLLFEFVVEE